MKSGRLFQLAFLLMVAGLLTNSGSAAERTPAVPLFNRIVLIGASATAGFSVAQPANVSDIRQYSLGRYIDAALLAPHEPVRNFANALFFAAPEELGSRQINRALQVKPTLIVGVDFLFWYCYGELAKDEVRSDAFERGLKILEQIECPLVLGNIPDESAADPELVPRDAIPTPRELAAANRRLKDWAAGRTNVILLDLSGFVREAMANRALTIHGHTLPAGHTLTLIQADHLHPTFEGSAALAAAVFDAVFSAQTALPKNSVLWDSAEILRRSRRAATNGAAAASQRRPPSR